MERKQRVVLYGNTVALAGIEASIHLDRGCEVVGHAWPIDPQALCSLDPDVVIFELDAVGPEFPYALSKARPGLLLIGIDAETNRARLWCQQQAEGWTSQDLRQLIHQASFPIPLARRQETWEKTDEKEPS